MSASDRTVDLDPEKRAARVMLHVAFLLDELFGPLGLEPEFAWYILEVQYRRLQNQGPRSRDRGDVDILAGRLAWHDPGKLARALLAGTPPGIAVHALAAEGGLRWPPPTDHLVACELKHAERDVHSRRIRSVKGGARKVKEARRQVEQHLRLGFDRVALIHVVDNPALVAPGVHPWLGAGALAGETGRRSELVFGRRLEKTPSVGQFVLSLGAVEGRRQEEAGSLKIRPLFPSLPNPHLQQEACVRLRREYLAKQLEHELAQLPKPTGFPVLLVDCRCGKIHGLEAPCPT